MSASFCITGSQPCELSREPFVLAKTNTTFVAVVGWKTQLRGQLIRVAAIVKEDVTSFVYFLDIMLCIGRHREWPKERTSCGEVQLFFCPSAKEEAAAHSESAGEGKLRCVLLE